jgi:hypothetical protein
MLLVLNFYSLTVLPIDCGPGILEQAIFFIDFSTLWLEVASGRQRGEPFFDTVANTTRSNQQDAA